MKIYVDENQKYYETKSSAQTLTGVSIAGAILIILVDLDIIPLNMDVTNKAIFSSVMGLMLLIFFIIGIRSFFALKKIASTAKTNDNIYNEAVSYFMDNCRSTLIERYGDTVNAMGDDYFLRSDYITSKIKDRYPDLSEEFLDHIVEDIYSQIYN